MGPQFRNSLANALAIASSATAYFYGTGLHPLWILTWLAPLPIFIIAVRHSKWAAALAAFSVFALGGVNQWAYFRVVASPVVAVIVVVVPALIFAGITVVFRWFVLRGQLIRATLAVPSLWVAIDCLSELNSPHGTFGNLGYTQMDFLPILQIVSIAGIWSIAFLLFLVPAAIAAATAPVGTPQQRCNLLAGTALLLVLVLGFGWFRLRPMPDGPRVMVGLIDTDAPAAIFPQGTAAVELIRSYAEQVAPLAKRGVEVIVIPEKLGRFTPQEMQQADEILSEAARANRVAIVAGFQHLPDRNESRLYSSAGTLEATYEKHHMLPAFEGKLLPGTERVLVARSSGKWGLTICKDMDFPLLSRQYALDGAGLMLVPAWDFVDDGWLHGRMAIMRGVESGFSMARAPRQGILAVTDDRGRILAQQETGAAPFATVVASVPVKNNPTFYARHGDWFVWANLGLLVAIFAWPSRRLAKSA
jgi:apolipoprotein N-acyltransferase